jgi:hypothetical protein
MTNPLVTCACLTRDRREWLPRAIACFLAQTYEPRELLIVATGRDAVDDLIPLGDPRIRLITLGWVPRIRLITSGWVSLAVGTLRNVACESAAGALAGESQGSDRLPHDELYGRREVVGIHGKSSRVRAGNVAVLSPRLLEGTSV